MSRITEVIDLYEKGDLATGQFSIELVRNLTPEEVPELLKLAPPEVLQRLKEDALCGKRLNVVWMGSWLAGGVRDAWEHETEIFNKGLGVLRESLK